MDTLRREISDIPLSRRVTDWSEYYKDTPSGIDPSDEWRPKQRVFYELINRIMPRTLVDIGSNRAVYGQIAARRGITVAAFDRDEVAIGDLYRDAKERALGVTPLVCDLMNPTPAHGLNFAWFPSIRERLASDMAVALALVHHLVFKARLDFTQIVDFLAGFAKKWLLVEFIPRDDRYVKEWLAPEHAWYTTSAFLSSLKRRFRRIEVIPSDPAPRILVLAQR